MAKFHYLIEQNRYNTKMPDIILSIKSNSARFARFIKYGQERKFTAPGLKSQHKKDPYFYLFPYKKVRQLSLLK